MSKQTLNDEAKTTEAENEENKNVDTEGEETKRKDEPSKIDYDAELEIEKKRGKPDPEKARKAFQERHEKVKEEDEVEDEKPLTKAQLEEILSSRTEIIRKEVYADRISEIANELASDPKEALLMVEIHKNRTFPQGLSLRDQLEEAQAIANRKKLISTNNELKRALLSKDTASKDTANAQIDPMESNAPKMSANDAQAYVRAGYKFNSKDRVYERKLPNGKILVKDPKTKKTWLK